MVLRETGDGMPSCRRRAGDSGGRLDAVGSLGTQRNGGLRGGHAKSKLTAHLLDLDNKIHGILEKGKQLNDKRGPNSTCVSLTDLHLPKVLNSRS